MENKINMELTLENITQGNQGDIIVHTPQLKELIINRTGNNSYSVARFGENIIHLERPVKKDPWYHVRLLAVYTLTDKDDQEAYEKFNSKLTEAGL